MIATRVIPCLLLRNQGLVKTVGFRDPKYLGDPINVVRIFNDKEVDEIFLLDITAKPERRGPPFELLTRIASECFMPVGYGGGVTTVEQMHRLFELGIEKVAVNSAAVARPALVREAADIFGSQSVVVSLDVKRRRFGGYEVMASGGQERTGLDPVAHAREMERLGAGELLLNSIDRDGTMRGYDLDLVRRVTAAVAVPVVACGGAGSLRDMGAVVRDGGAAAAAAGSLFVFHGPHRAVLISYPSLAEIRAVMED